MSYSQILFDVTDKIATITLNNPKSKNALSPTMRIELSQVMEKIKEQAGDQIKVVILTGAGGAFCAGGDIKSMGARLNSATKARAALRNDHQKMYDLMNLELPVISLVDGAAAGAGANIALAADFVLATPRGFLMQAFVRIGLLPDWGGMYILPKLIGLQRAKELVFTGRRVYAKEANEMGLVYEVVGQDTAMAEARKFAMRFVDAPTQAIGLAKNVMNQSYNLDYKAVLEMEAMAQSISRESDFHAEAIRRFSAKEPALFDWESYEKK
jgi:2-(1,2-epoxy-1,2-dihydrophenyl)acetyl-CoA isomerase